MELYRHQVGGHTRLIKPRNSAFVYKPFAEREFIFYEQLAAVPDERDEGVSQSDILSGARPTIKPGLMRSVSSTSDHRGGYVAAELIESAPDPRSAGEARAGHSCESREALQTLKHFVPRYFGVVETPIAAPTFFPPGTTSPTSTTPPSTSPIAMTPSTTATALSACTLSVATNQSTKSAADADLIEGRRSKEGQKSATPGVGGDKVTETPTSLGPRESTFSATDTPIGCASQRKTQIDPMRVWRCLQKWSPSSPLVLKYIVLEDLVYQYKRPCVMDLKMGVRQRTAGASFEKEQRQMEKSLKTTSHVVGFRLCGCQFYNEKTDTFCFRDKYWGRKVTNERVAWSIKQWFFNGLGYYHELIAPLISKLATLHACLSGLPQYRFWSSSLLWVFDGGSVTAAKRLSSLRVKMIDFANTVTVPPVKPHQGYLFGLDNLIRILCTIRASLTLARPVSDSVGVAWCRCRRIIVDDTLASRRGKTSQRRLRGSALRASSSSQRTLSHITDWADTNDEAADQQTTVA